MIKSVYQQLFDDPQCQKLQPVTINTVMHDHSKAEVLRSVTIRILKDNKKHGITFQVVPYETSTLLSCEKVTKHGLVIIPEQKQPPKNAIVYGSSVDIKYINFLQKNKSQTATWNTAPKQPLTSLDEIKVQYKKIFEGNGMFPGTTSILTPVFHQNGYHVDQVLFTSKMSPKSNLMRCLMPV